MTKADFTLEGTTPERWDELERIERKGDQNSDKQRLDQLFADMNEGIAKVDADSLNTKMGIVKNTAQRIEEEGLLPVERIANEIVHQLKGKISPTYVRKNLDDKYKDSRQSTNAKKQKKVGDTSVATKSIEPQVKPSSEVEVAKADAIILKGVNERVAEPTNINNIAEQTPELGDLKNIGSEHSTVLQLPFYNESTTTENSTTKESPRLQLVTGYNFQVLIDWEELLLKISNAHSKNIKNFWLSGRIQHGTKKLLDMVVEIEDEKENTHRQSGLFAADFDRESNERSNKDKANKE